MHIEIKDLKSGKVHRIEEKGATIGRDKARSSIVVDDSGVSGAHAKIYLRDGQWYIEDLKSSNGTWVDDHRVTSSSALNEGSRIKLFNYKLEVTGVEAVASDGATAVFSAETAIADPSKKEHAAPAAAEEPEEEEDDIAPQEPVKSERPKNKTGGVVVGDVPAKSAPKAEPKPKTGAHAAPVSDDVPVSKGDKDAFMANVMEAIAYYIVAIPKLLFNFRGSVKDSIENQKFGAMKPPQLIAWSVPSLALGQIVTQVAALVIMIVGGHFAPVSWVISLVIGLAIAAVSAIISGFIFHPVLKWIINFLKGSSTDVSRSNYFVMLMTSAGLSTMVSGVSVLFALIPLPFVGAIPLVLGLGASLIGLYVAYCWLEYFGVVKWLLLVLKILGVLVIASTAWGLFGLVRAGIATIGSHIGSSSGSTEVVIPAGLTAEQAAAMKTAQEQAAKAMAGMTAEQQAQVKAAQEQAAKAMAAANAGQAQGVAVPTPSAMQVPPPSGSALPPPTPPPPSPAGAKPATPPPPAPTPAPAAAAKPVTPPPPPAAAEPRGKSGDDYATYLQKREAVEQAIEKNPALLARGEGVLPLYKQLHIEEKKITEKYAHQKGGKDVVTERLRDAEMYDRTVDQVDALYRKVVGQ